MDFSIPWPWCQSDWIGAALRVQSERDVRETHCTAETNFMGKNLSTCLKKTADTGNVFTHLSSYHALFRNVHVFLCFCGFRVLFCWEVFASLVSYGSYLCRLKSRNTCNHLIHDLKMIRVIPRGTKSKPSSSFLFLNADFWSSLFAVTCASIIVSADADKCIKIMRSLERLSFAQLPGITPQYLRGGTTWAWFRITALLAHSLSVTLHHSFRKMFYPPPTPLLPLKFG